MSTPRLREQHELACRARVAPAAVRGPHLLGPQEVVADQAVDDRRLAHARRPEQRAGSARDRDIAAARPPCRARGRTSHAPARSRRPRARRRPSRPASSTTSALFRTITGRRAAFGRDEQVPLDPSRVEVSIEARDEKHDVDVRRDDLFLGGVAGRATGKAAVPRQDRDDTRVAATLGGRERRPSRRPPESPRARHAR